VIIGANKKAEDLGKRRRLLLATSTGAPFNEPHDLVFGLTPIGVEDPGLG